MKLIYLGNVIDPEQLSKYPNASVAGNKMQFFLLKELSKYADLDIIVISSEIHGMFPKEKKIFVRKNEFKLFKKIRVINLPYINIPFLKQFFLKKKTYSTAKRIISKQCGDEDIAILSYNLYPTQGNTISKISKLYNIPSIALLADMTIGGVRKTRNVFRKMYQKYEDKSTLKYIGLCNNYIVLNENFIKQFAPSSNYIVIDGGVDVEEHLNIQGMWDGNEKNVLYTGALVDYSGIMNLIGAMDYLKDKSIFLDIYGDGPLEDEIKKKAQLNKRIRFFGKVPNRDILIKQRCCWALINPRPIDNDIARVTFPSKIFEYLMSERPVISTKLNGFQKDYDDLLFWTGDTPESLAKTIDAINLVSEEQLLERARKAKEYLLKNKTWEINSSKIYNLIRLILGKHNG